MESMDTRNRDNTISYLDSAIELMPFDCLWIGHCSSQLGTISESFCLTVHRNTSHFAWKPQRAPDFQQESGIARTVLRGLGSLVWIPEIYTVLEENGATLTLLLGLASCEHVDMGG